MAPTRLVTLSAFLYCLLRVCSADGDTCAFPDPDVRSSVKFDDTGAELVLYGSMFSQCSRRVMTAILEKGQTFKLENIDLSKGQHKAPEHLARQPFGQIPVLEDSDIQIFESRAIARYVAEKYAGQGTELLGTTGKERATIYTWLEVEAQNFNPPASAIVKEAVFHPMMNIPTDREKVSHLAEQLAKVLDVYEKQLEGRAYLAGDAFSLADLVHLPYASMLFRAGQADLIESRPNVSRWWKSIATRPSWRKVTGELSGQAPDF